MILSMTDGIDDEAEPAAPGILNARDQEPTLIVAGSPVTADDRYDDVVSRMTFIEGPTIPGPTFTVGQLGAVDRLPFIRPGIADGLFGSGPLVAGEQLRKAERHDRPLAIFLVPGGILAQQRMDFGIAIGREVKASVAGRAVGDHTFGIDDRNLRAAPGGCSQTCASVRGSARLARVCDRRSRQHALETRPRRPPGHRAR